MTWDFNIMNFEGIYSVNEGGNVDSNNTPEELENIIKRGTRNEKK